MVQTIYDLQMEGKGKFNTSLADSAVGVILKAMSRNSVIVVNISDTENGYLLETSHGNVEFNGSDNTERLLEKLYNERYKLLNERFDRRAEVLLKHGYVSKDGIFKKEHCSSIPNASVMHADEFMWSRYLNMFGIR